MSTTSTVVAFRAALVAGLQAHDTVTGDGIQVTDGWPGPDTQAEGIYLADVEGVSEIANLGAGRKRRNEEYRQTVVVQTFRAAHTPQQHDTAVARTFALFAALEDVIADAPTTGGVQWGFLSAFSLTTVPFESGWASRLTTEVTCNARLT